MSAFLETNPDLERLMKGEQVMEKWKCIVCGYIYDPAEGDPDNGVAAGTEFKDLPDDWTCPVCSASKMDFEPEP